MVELTADMIVNLFEEDVRARKRLAELLVMEPDVRLAIINAVLRDVATKDDIEKLRREMREEIEKLRGELRESIGKLDLRLNRLENRINGLENRISGLEGQVGILIKVFIAFNLPILLSLIGILLKMILT